MNDQDTAPTGARPTSPRRVRSIVDPAHDRPETTGAVVDHTKFVTSRRAQASIDPDEVLESGERRLVRIVLFYAGAATIWLALLGILTSAVLGITDWSPVTVTVAVGIVFVLGSSGLMLLALRRWARQLTNAAAAEKQALDSLREVARIRAAFLGGISHELRTPMTNILGFAQTIQTHHRQLGETHLEQFAGRLVANTTRLERLVVDMLDLHRQESTDEVREEPVHLEQLLRAALAATGPREQEITVWSPAQWALTDRPKVERIVAELVGNVLRHTPPGTRAWLQAEVHEDAGILTLSMEDDGPGLDQSLLGEATTPFVQGAAAGASPSPGLGIGLSLARRYAELLGGHLALGRPTGGGTRVTVTLPYRAVEVPTT